MKAVCINNNNKAITRKEPANANTIVGADSHLLAGE
jgi:hypothetical protein